MASLNQGILLRIALPDVPIARQHKIVAILSAYDDLIENNNHRIRILEEMAHRIYCEWFVDFRYPGHEGVPLVDSQFGPIPEGWALTPASEALEIDPRLPLPTDRLVPFVPMTSLSETLSHISEVEMRRNPGGSRFANGDTLFARITPCLENGKTAFVHFLPDETIGAGSTEFIVLRGRLVPPEFVYCLARSERFRENAVKSMSGATGRQRVRREALDSYLLPVPTVVVAGRFAECVGPLFVLSLELWESQTPLRSARDILLRRLITGEIDVADLDIPTDEEFA